MKKISTLCLGLFAFVALLSGQVSAAVYEVDTTHTTVGFSATHLVISNVSGKFNSFSGSVEIDADKNISNIQAEIDVTSIDTANQKRDEHLRSGDFFDAEKNPKITFKSTSVKKLEGNKYQVIGDLTIRGVTKAVTLEGELIGMIQSQYVGSRAGFRAEGKINRMDFGVSWNKQMDFGGWAVGEEITLKIDAEVIEKK
ncbi:MAG: YceI family protein [SAR324 cluster bacterium]|nr:YceI family protein [SAR324 cluster bacterium]